MDNRKFRVLSWVIVVAILMTVLAQGYWNWRNYQENKRFLLSEIQMALDNAVEQYYAQLAKIHFIQMGENQLLPAQLNPSSPISITTDSTITKAFKYTTTDKEIQKIQWNVDSLVKEPHTNMVIVSKVNRMDTVVGTEKRFVKLASRLAMSLEADSLNQNAIDSLMALELARKGIHADFKIVQEPPVAFSNREVIVQANSTYLATGNELYLSIQPSFAAVLKKGIGGVIVSLLTALIVIMVLLYLYRFIQHQKSLDLMKNDLISNITHEFKTPIATVSTALEAIEKFNTAKDTAKTAKYLKLSNEQLTKLNGMVEKLLDTATLEEGELILNIEKNNLNELVQSVLEKYEDIPNKTITWLAKGEIWVELDAFHFEHAISNLIDNAMKYGGDQIQVSAEQNENELMLSVVDNGIGISKKEQARIFDKFYRISSGNVHDVKGYGIGLYYAKTIVEKHGGHLVLIANPEGTTFKITLPL
ncbi:sensor histidine kinase [Reichenbachiella faecimaris]|nr:HAMP domain-containing sensor histidine kinase [Reichenbachiella faecimaris]